MAGRNRSREPGRATRSCSGERGAVLIIALMIMAGLAVVSVDLSRNVLLDHAFSQTARSGIAAKPLLATGENLAARFLVYDFQHAPSADGVESFAAMRGRFQAWLENYTEKLKKSGLEIEIEDENSRFPLRGLFPAYSSEKTRAEQYARMFARMLATLLILHGFEGGEDAASASAEAFVGELLAWGGVAVLSDEAAQWYLSRDVPYYPPGRPPESLAELLLLYWPAVDGELARNVLLGTGNAPGLLASCSIWSRGPINLNTMRTAVGWGFGSTCRQSLEFMEAFEAARAAQGELLRPGWHRDVFAAFAIQQPQSNVLAEKSRWFRTRVRVTAGAASNSAEAVGWIDKTRMTWVSRAIM